MKKGNFNISSVFKGSKKIDKILKGTLVVYEAFKKLIASGVPPITLQKCKGVDLVNYKIYGNSVQDGTPTPDTPIEIESVGDKTDNLFPNVITNTSYANGSTVTKNKDGSITLKKVAGDMVSIKNSFSLPAGTYTINTGLKSGNMSLYFQLDRGDNNTFITATTTENIKTFNHIGGYIRIVLFSSQNYENKHITLYPQILSGIYTKDTLPSYEPYGYKIPVTVRGKNLIDIQNIKKTLTRCTLENVNNGVKIISTDDDKAGYITMNLNGIVTKGKTYTLSFISERSGTTGGGTRVTIDGDLDINILSNNGYFSGTFTAGDENVLSFYANTNAGVKNDFSILTDIQLEEETTATDYVPYVEPVTTNIYLDEPLRKIGDYADYIDFENKKVVRNVKETILNGDERNGWSTLESGNKLFYRTKLDGKGINLVMPPDTTYEGQLCNYLPSSAVTTSNTDIGMSVYYSESQGFTIFRIRFPEGVITDGIEQYLKDLYASGNPIKYYYATSKMVEKNVDLPNIPTHKGTTIIEVDTSILPSNMEVTYLGKN